MNLEYYYSKYTTLTPIYNLLRKIKKYDAIGDYPLLAIICTHSNEHGRRFNKNDIHQALKEANDKEFRNIPVNHTLVKQLYALQK